MAREAERLTEHFLAERQRGAVPALGATEFAVRTAMQRVGSVLLEQMLNSDHGGHRGQRVACGDGHQAEFIDYRLKQLQTILGMVRLERAYYHCAQCPAERRGSIPKDHDLDVVGTSLSPGLRRLMARVGAQEAFAAAHQDLAELAKPETGNGRLANGAGQRIDRFRISGFPFPGFHFFSARPEELTHS